MYKPLLLGNSKQWVIVKTEEDSEEVEILTEFGVFDSYEQVMLFIDVLDEVEDLYRGA